MPHDYAFAPPHRIALSRPEAGDKTLVNFTRDLVTVSWSYQNLRDVPVNVWKPPVVEWGVELSASAGGKRIDNFTWKRPGGYLPGFEAQGEVGGVRLTLTGLACAGGDVVRVTFGNGSAEETYAELAVEHRKGGWVISNPAWVDGRDPNCLLCMEMERPDRLLVMAAGADEYPVDIPADSMREISVPMTGAESPKERFAAKTMILRFHLDAGETKTGYVYRPYRAYRKELQKLRATNFERLLADAREEWRALAAEGAKIEIGEYTNEYYACLCDAFVMAETDALGHRVTSPGTEVYRSTNTTEACLTSTLLDQMGYCGRALAEQAVHMEGQGEDGDWCDPEGWGHDIWCLPGFKARTVMEYYYNHRDRGYLAAVYPRMKASALWNESMRAKTRENKDPLTRGLMPRGMGDCGLVNGSDYFGVFYPHNFYAVMADKLAYDAACELGYDEDAKILFDIWNRALLDLRASLEIGCLSDADGKWIPAVPGKPGGSTWGALTAGYPCGILSVDDPLILSTLDHIERRVSPIGQPIGNGWMPDGCWVAISLDNFAMAKLALGDGDGASQCLTSALRYASDFTTWCEERGWEAGSDKTSGDLQHLWTPIAVAGYVRNAIVFEFMDETRLLSGLPRECLADGEHVLAEGVYTRYGKLSVRAERRGSRIEARVSGIPKGEMYLRVPERDAKFTLVSCAGCEAALEGEIVRLSAIRGEATLCVEVV